MSPPLTVAAAQPACALHDPVANGRAHADAVRAALARVVVFPELSLTGYDLDADLVSPDDACLEPIAAACVATGAVALVGAPVAGPFIAVLRVDRDGVRVAYRKCWLGVAEARRFRPGRGPAVLDVDGHRVGLGVCRDTGVAAHLWATAALGVDLYVAGIAHRPEERAEHDVRAVTIARACDAHVVFASFAGATGGGFDETAGSSAIWSPDGSVLARAGTAAGEIARATLE